VNADLSIPIIFDEAPTLPQNAALDEYESMEGLSGTRFNDVLRAPTRWPKSVFQRLRAAPKASRAAISTRRASRSSRGSRMFTGSSPGPNRV